MPPRAKSKRSLPTFRADAAGAALLAIGVTERALAERGESVLDRVGRVMVDTTPLPMVEIGIRLLGTSDKPAIRANVLGGGVLAAGFGTGLVGRNRPRRTLAGLVMAAAGLAANADARRQLAARESEQNKARRRVTAQDPLPTPLDGAEEWPGAEPLFTPTHAFYRTDVNLRAPLIGESDWSLEISGVDGTSSRLTFEELLDLPGQERDSVLACVHNRLGWDRLGHQRWTGLSVMELFERAGVPVPESTDAYDLVMEAVDGYRQVLRLDVAANRDSWVVWGMGGAALSAGHGFPARVLTPGVVGQYGGVKWLTRLQITKRGDQKATWVRAGWPEGPVLTRPMSRIDHPGRVAMPPRLPQGRVKAENPVRLVGIAWAPANGGVADVQVRFDGGDWISADLAGNLGPHSWRRWRIERTLDAGNHTAEVRSIAADGSVQESTPSQPFPDGATGLHALRIRVAG